jgi:fatty acid desaturase
MRMVKALLNSDKASAVQGKRTDWRRKMSDHVAFALLIYTGLQIFVTMGALHNNGETILPFFALVLLVAAIIPGARMFEQRWEKLDDNQAADPALAGAFHRDAIKLWIVALALPLVVTGLIRGVELLV